MKKLTVYECHSLGDRSPLAMFDTMVGASSYVAAYARTEGWQIAFWTFDDDHRDCADCILKKDGKTKVLCVEPMELH